MSLIEKGPGFTGTVQEILGNEWITTRLREMGIIPGVEIKIRGFAPFGDPMILEVHGVSLALRKAEAQCIQI